MRSRPLRDALRREARAELRAWGAAAIIIIVYLGLRAMFGG